MNEREAAQATPQHGTSETVTIAVLVDVLGAPDWVRGFQFRAMRRATRTDLLAALKRMEGVDLYDTGLDNL